MPTNERKAARAMLAALKTISAEYLRPYGFRYRELGRAMRDARAAIVQAEDAGIKEEADNADE